MLPGSTNPRLLHPPIGPAPAMRSALTQLWHCGTSECQGEHGHQSRGWGSRTTVQEPVQNAGPPHRHQAWACSVTILGRPGCLNTCEPELCFWNQTDEHENNLQDEPAKSGNGMSEQGQQVKGHQKPKKQESKSSVTAIGMPGNRQEPSSWSSCGECRKRAVKITSGRSFLPDK